MRVLITGGTGFIGSRLALRHIEAGDAVRVLGREQSAAEQANAAELRGAGVELHPASVTDRAALASALADVDLVFHLAAAQHEAGAPDSHFRAINVDGTRHVMAAAADAGVRRVVHGSTIGVYEAPPGVPVNERSPLRPQNIYGVTKLAAEEVVRREARDTPWVIARISETYGPGDRRLLKLFRAAARGWSVQIGAGANLHHLVYVDDLLDGLDSAAHTAAANGRIYVLAGPEPVTTAALLAGVQASLGRSGHRLRLPLAPLLGLAAALEAALRPLGVQPPLHRRRMDFFLKSFAFAQDDARRELGYAPKIELAQGLLHTAAWYRAQQLL